MIITHCWYVPFIVCTPIYTYTLPEAIVVVRESVLQQMREVLERFQSRDGVRMKFSLFEIPDQEDWGTADSLRALRSRVKVKGNTSPR